jgi:O-antigen/teichoic acid export membrane protein
MRAGMPQKDALELFGVATGMVMPLIGTPLTVIGSLAIVLVPELAEDHQKRNLRRLQANVERALFFAVALACLLIPLFLAVGQPLTALIYQNLMAGEMLSRVAFLLLPMSVCAVIISVLNSLGFEKQTFVASLIGSAIFVLCILFLPALIGVYAYHVGLFLQLSIEGLYGWFLLKKHCPLPRRFYQKSALCLALTLPLGILGQWILQGCLLVFGEWLACIFAAIAVLLCTVAAYALLKLLPTVKIQKKISPSLDK